MLFSLTLWHNFLCFLAQKETIYDQPTNLLLKETMKTTIFLLNIKT